MVTEFTLMSELIDCTEPDLDTVDEDIDFATAQFRLLVRPLPFPVVSLHLALK